MSRYVCCYTVVEYDKKGQVNGVYSDCFTLNCENEKQAEAEVRRIAEDMNPDRRVHVILAKGWEHEERRRKAAKEKS